MEHRMAVRSQCDVGSTRQVQQASEIWVLVERYAAYIGMYRRFGITYESHLQE
jgi:hypothetical protein